MRKAIVAASLLLLACSIVVSAGWAQHHPADHSEIELCFFDGIVRMDGTDPTHHHNH